MKNGGKIGEGKISSNYSKTITFTFGNGDAVLTPKYVYVWTVKVVNGIIGWGGYDTQKQMDEGDYQLITVRTLKPHERFDGWTQEGPGTIENPAATETHFYAGHGDAVITANISEYPDKRLTISWRDPETNVDTVVSSELYKYGSKIENIEAPVAPNETTFSSWLGDVDLLSPSALASTVTINSLTADTHIIATYYYPKAPEKYTLSVYNGSGSNTYEVGTQIPIEANEPNQGWEFFEWYGDTQYLVNPDLTLSKNAVIMPAKSITLYAKFKVIGELPLYEIKVVNGIAQGSYVTGEEPEEGEEDTRVTHNESGPEIYLPPGTTVTLIADADTVGHKFDHWEGNFEEAGVNDIVKTTPTTIFTMVKHDLQITMVRVERETYNVYTTNAIGPGSGVYARTYDISAILRDTEEYKDDFIGWTCVDADGNNCIDAIADPTSPNTTITVTDRSLWIEAKRTTNYRLIVVKGQDSGDGYYYEGEVVSTVYADTPTEESRTQFDHWEDPMGVVTNIYDKTPTIIMKNTVATITAVFTSLDATGNSVVMTSGDIQDKLITRQDSYLINGIYSVGTLVFDKDGRIGAITLVDPDNSDDSSDYQVDVLFYGGGTNG